MKIKDIIENLELWAERPCTSPEGQLNREILLAAASKLRKYQALKGKNKKLKLRLNQAEIDLAAEKVFGPQPANCADLLAEIECLKFELLTLAQKLKEKENN